MVSRARDYLTYCWGLTSDRWVILRNQLKRMLPLVDNRMNFQGTEYRLDLKFSFSGKGKT